MVGNEDHFCNVLFQYGNDGVEAYVIFPYFWCL